MSPTIFRARGYRFLFFSREETRMHVHVLCSSGEAKFWLTPVVHLATSTGLSPRQITDAQGVVQAHMKEIEDAWNHHFGG
jgi:hypothetical protein